MNPTDIALKFALVPEENLPKSALVSGFGDFVIDSPLSCLDFENLSKGVLDVENDIVRFPSFRLGVGSKMRVLNKHRHVTLAYVSVRMHMPRFEINNYLCKHLLTNSLTMPRRLMISSERESKAAGKLSSRLLKVFSNRRKTKSRKDSDSTSSGGSWSSGILSVSMIC